MRYELNKEKEGFGYVDVNIKYWKDSKQIVLSVTRVNVKTTASGLTMTEMHGYDEKSFNCVLARVNKKSQKKEDEYYERYITKGEWIDFAKEHGIEYNFAESIKEAA